MKTILAKQIYARMKAKDISTIQIEREAGLKAHAVRNILRGHSTRPGVDIVQAIARILNCAIDDLLQGQNIFTEDKKAKNREDIETQPYHPGLLIEAIKLVDKLVAKRKQKLTNHQALTCIEETYLHSIQKGDGKVDKDFAEWFIELMIDAR